QVVVATLLVGRSSAGVLPVSLSEYQDLPRLSTFQDVHHQVSHNPDGTYHFSFSLPQQSRAEERDADGKVTGSFAFVDPVGKEVSVRYDADDEGFRPESDALPQEEPTENNQQGPRVDASHPKKILLRQAVLHLQAVTPAHVS
ncbi:Cuticle protein 6-like 7, partial [Homarus americanus]